MMPDQFRGLLAVGFVCFICMMAWSAVVLSTFRNESRLWRSLIQQYLQKVVHAPLPVDEDPDAPVESRITIPDDLREQWEREDAEQEE